MSRNLIDRTIIITGASSGIGAATALQAANAGMNVVLNARREDRLREIAERIRSLGRMAEVVVGDVAQRNLSAALLDCADQKMNGFYAVFANAGYGINAAITDMTEDELRRIFEVNFFASVDLLRKSAHRLLARNERGHLLMCSSCVAKFTLPANGAYSATKAAQNHICRAMRMELHHAGIEVASVMPVTTETEFFNAADGGGNDSPNVRTPGPRMFIQSPEKVARAVIRCLQRPRPEVWTSWITRAGAAAMTMWPSLVDRLMPRIGKRRDRDRRAGRQ